MALVNHAKREINAKIVFFGPGFSGKRANLNHIYRKLKPEHRGKLKAANIGDDRMIFFDFSPSGQGKVGAYDVRFHLYTIAGEAKGDTAWKMVLKGVDGVVFVADSTPERLSANLESLSDLQKILTLCGINLAELPCVLQCNKRDIAAPLPLDEMEKALNGGRYPLIPASAGKGEGVIESLYSLMKKVLGDLRKKGLELDREPEQFAGVTEEVSGREGRSGPEMAVNALAAGTAGGVVPAGAPSLPAQSSSGARDALLEVAGEPEMLPGGRLRLNLNLKYGEIEKKIALTLAVSLLPD
ncbi:MAG TPA: ADP-ribosylation factor-like protein [Geobacteraceae bacterium]|nr:ADP-ribosylation factor-like protein [Geobacteraceae bacterium]